MAKAAVTKKYSLNADSILDIKDGVISIEIQDSGEIIDLATLLSDFADRSIKLSVNYSEDY